MSVTSDNFTIEVDLATMRVQADRSLSLGNGCLIAFCGCLANDDGGGAARLVAARRARGLSFTHDLLGQYAGALIDPASRRVVLFQDALGSRTLYYAIAANRLMVSSELAPLRALAPGALDERYFAHLLCRGTPSPTRTPFRDIAKLGSGINVELVGGSRRISGPWVPPPWTPFAGDPDRALRNHLDDAVAAFAPKSAGQLLCELSGGLDSSTVTATVAKLGATPAAITYVSSAGLMGEDETYAATLVERLGLPWQQLDFDLHPRYSLPPTHFLGEPGNEPHQAIQRGYRDIVQAVGAKIILTGVGGDVILGYGGIHPLHLADDLARGRITAAMNTARTWSREIDQHRPWTHYFARFGIKPALRYAVGGRLNAGGARDLPRWLTPHILRIYRAERGGPIVRRGGAPSRQFLWDTVLDMCATQAASAFRTGLPAQTRHPLLHQPLVEFMIGLDWRLRGGGGREATNRDRVLQRRALGDRLPRDILMRASKGSDQPLHEIVLLRSSAFIDALLDDARLVQRGWVDQAAWAEQLARARFGVFDSLAHVDAAITCEMWLRTLELPCETLPRLLPQATC